MGNLTASQFVRKSIDLNLFFLRIMKEHSFFLEAAFVPQNSDMAKIANDFKDRFNLLLSEAVEMANENVSQIVLSSGEIRTNKTLSAEEKTEDLSGIAIDTDLTKREAQLMPGMGNPALENQVFEFNARVIAAVRELVEFKTRILNEMLDCTLFTYNFPLLIEHIRREARFFINHLMRLQERRSLDPKQEIMEEKVFWDRIMAEHSLFIAHFLDPNETALIKQADLFADRFFKLEKRAKAVNKLIPRELLNDEINATRSIKQFKNTADEAILACQIRSIIIPLLADHVLREANHFYAILTHTPIPNQSSKIIRKKSAKKIVRKRGGAMGK